MHPRRSAREGTLSALHAFEHTGETRAKALDDLLDRNIYDGES